MPMDMLILPVEIQGLQQKHQLQLVPRIPRSVPRAILAKTMLHVIESSLILVLLQWEN